MGSNSTLPPLLPCLQVLRLEPHCVISNRTGVPLQIMHHSPSNRLQRLGGKALGVQPSRSQQPHQAPPGLKGVVADPRQDWTSCIDVPAGAITALFHACKLVVTRHCFHQMCSNLLWKDAIEVSHVDMPAEVTGLASCLDNLVTRLTVYLCVTGALGVPVHWSMKSESRAVCLRFGPQTAASSSNAPWSHPVEASFPGGVDHHVAIPVAPPEPAETAKPGRNGPLICSFSKGHTEQTLVGDVFKSSASHHLIQSSIQSSSSKVGMSTSCYSV